MVNLAHCESGPCESTEGEEKTTRALEYAHKEGEGGKKSTIGSLHHYVFGYTTCIIQILPWAVPAGRPSPRDATSRLRVDKQSMETGPSRQMSFLSSSFWTNGFLSAPSSWKEPVSHTNPEVSHNYRLVSTDFHQQLCVWWSGRNVNDSSIGVNQLQAPQWPAQHSPTELCMAVKCARLCSALWESASGQYGVTRHDFPALPRGSIKESAFPAKSFIF